MISEISWKEEFTKEVERAIQARSEGNEGMARVCARRAAGIVVGEYLRRQGVVRFTNSVYDRITLFNTLPNIDAKCKEVCRHFLMKVNEEHKLPGDTDLVQDVYWLKEQLLSDKQD